MASDHHAGQWRGTVATPRVPSFCEPICKFISRHEPQIWLFCTLLETLCVLLTQKTFGIWISLVVYGKPWYINKCLYPNKMISEPPPPHTNTHTEGMVSKDFGRRQNWPSIRISQNQNNSDSVTVAKTLNPPHSLLLHLPKRNYSIPFMAVLWWLNKVCLANTL